MSSSGSTSAASTGSTAQSPHQERLITLCRTQGARLPNFQIVSDRRGGRTAWSCVVTIGSQQIPARFWYDGQYVNNAREDAAERALQYLGVLPSPPTPQSNTQLRQPQQSQGQSYGAT